MSQLVDEKNSELRELWPGNIVTCCPIRSLLPPMSSTLDEIGEWAYVGNIDDDAPYKGKTLFYKDYVTADSHVVPVKVTLYGIVSRVCLTPLGNWKGSDDDVISAVRMIELTDGGSPSVFQQQTKAIDALRQYVAYIVRAQSAMQNPTLLRLQQRVFTKIREDDTLPPESTLKVGDDPEGLAARVSDKWTVTCDIHMQKRTSSGEFRDTSALAIGVGDFVEVQAAVDVIIRRGKRNTPKLVETRLRLTNVTRLFDKTHPQNPARVVIDTDTPMVGNKASA